MNLATFQRILTPEGARALALAESSVGDESDILRVLTRLRREFDAELAEAAVETVTLRRRATDKFSLASRMYFTREALEQSTSERVAVHRARRFARFPVVGDFACGIGGDAIALAAVADVVAVDLDETRLAMAAENLAVHGRRDRCKFLALDLLSEIPDVPAAFVDPSRRQGRHRTVRVQEYQPPLDVILSWLSRVPSLAVKLSPAVPFDELLSADAEIEFVSLGGELKECVLWLGGFRDVARRATLLPSGEELVGDGEEEPPDFAPPAGYLYDPDPAVTRAGLLPLLAARLDAHPLDPAERYLTASEFRATPFASVIAIEDAMPFHAKRMRTYLRERNVGRVEMRQRAIRLDTNAIMRDWKLVGDQFRIIVLASVRGDTWAVVGRPIG